MPRKKQAVIKSNIPLMSHQAEAVTAILTHPDSAFNMSGCGCVSADTEYLSPTGWKRIDEYDGGQVTQFWPDTKKIELVNPSEYVVIPETEFLVVAPRAGTSQVLSPEHRVLLYKAHSLETSEEKRRKPSYEVMSATDYFKYVKNSKSAPNKKVFACTFNTAGGAGMPFTDDMLRLLVAVAADGHFGSKSNRCTVRLKKQRKIERLRSLLHACELPFEEHACRGET